MPSLEQRLEMRKHPQETRIMYQEWRDLLFLHWKYDAELIQKSLPPGLTVDTFKGNAYISIVPFSINNLSIMRVPLPFVSEFVEVNVRTYVFDAKGVPGIWFYSLDINSKVATALARQVFSLPYFNSQLGKFKKDEEITISGERIEDAARMHFKYDPEGTGYTADEQSLDFFLLERYALFSFDANQLDIQKIHHAPYLIKKANVLEYKSNLFEINLLSDPQKEPDHAHYSEGVNVEFFPLKKV